MGHPPHPRVTPSGKGGSRRPHRGGKPSSERRSAASARLINLGPFQSRPRPRPPRPFAPPLTAHSLPHSFPGWLQGSEPRKLLFSATGDSREHPSRPATHADARRALRGHPHRPSSLQAARLSANSLTYEDGAARRVRVPGCAWNAKLSLCPREPALGTRAGSPQSQCPGLSEQGAWECGWRAAESHGSVLSFVNISVHKGREGTVSLHSHSLTVIN